MAVDVMARAIEDAVYLDEDAYNQMIPMQQYTRTIEVILVPQSIKEYGRHTREVCMLHSHAPQQW